MTQGRLLASGASLAVMAATLTVALSDREPADSAAEVPSPTGEAVWTTVSAAVDGCSIVHVQALRRSGEGKSPDEGTDITRYTAAYVVAAAAACEAAGDDCLPELRQQWAAWLRLLIDGGCVSP